MSRALALVIALYAIWRVAVVMGRRRDAAFAAGFPFTGRVEEARRCRRCGRIAPDEEMVARGRWPWRDWSCRDGCAAGGAGERPDALR